MGFLSQISKITKIRIGLFLIPMIIVVSVPSLNFYMFYFMEHDRWNDEIDIDGLMIKWKIVIIKIIYLNL